MTQRGQFEAFGTSHWVMILVCLIGIWPMIRIGRRYRPDPQHASRIFALVLIACIVPLQVMDHLPGTFELETSLPFQLCDLAALVSVIALWTRDHTAVCVTYLWGLFLTPQALITPALTAGFPHPRFITFWAMHILIVWAAVYLTFGLGIRPTWRGMRRTVALTMGWMLVLYPTNVALDTNYGFINAKPGKGSVLDFAGPWPVYLIVEIIVVAIAWALMTWPWTRRSSATAEGPGSPGPSLGVSNGT